MGSLHDSDFGKRQDRDRALEARGRIELRDLRLAVRIGTYAPGEVTPDTHVLDLALTIPANLILVAVDDMSGVFDYDPLIAEIDRLARDGHYATQERLVSRIAAACAGYPEITEVDISLRKGPILNGSGMIGVRLVLAAEDLAALRGVDARGLRPAGGA